jgi:hypothetical protein
METDPLGGCRKKIERASQHLRELEEKVAQWGDETPYRIDREVDPETEERILRLSVVRPPEVEDWGAIIGDVVHNLRSALDHLVCALVRQANPSHQCGGTAFPVLLEEGGWEGALKKLPGLDAWALRTIQGQQPFSPGKRSGRDHPLWILNRLDNIDKHRTLHVADLFQYVPEISFNPPGSAEVTRTHGGGPMGDGAELFRYRVTEQGAALQYNAQYGADVIFDDGSGPATGMNVLVLLPWLSDHVQWIIDLFGYKYFGGPAPSGTRRATVKATRSVTVEQSPSEGLPGKNAGG